MNLNISGHHLDLTPPLREYVTNKLKRIERHFDHLINADVILSVEKLRHNPEPLQEALGEVRPSGGTLWVVAPAPAHALRTNLKQGGLAHWLYTNCQLQNIIGRGRLDFRQQYLQVFGCPPAAAPAATAQVGASTSPLRTSTSR